MRQRYKGVPGGFRPQRHKPAPPPAAPRPPVPVPDPILAKLAEVVELGLASQHARDAKVAQATVDALAAAGRLRDPRTPNGSVSTVSRDPQGRITGMVRRDAIVTDE